MKSQSFHALEYVLAPPTIGGDKLGLLRANVACMALARPELGDAARAMLKGML